MVFPKREKKCEFVLGIFLHFIVNFFNPQYIYSMSTLKNLTSGLERKYKAYTVLCPLTMVGEIAIETLIPLMMKKIIDVGIANYDLRAVVRYGAIMVGMALVSLGFGLLGARFGAVASLGFSRNLRSRLFSKIQSFSFGNVDHFSSSSLVTRLTTDVQNLQNTYQMLIRITFRAPFMLIFGLVLAFNLNIRLSLIFAVAVPILMVALVVIGISAFPKFRVMLGLYDRMNGAVQENLTAIRVVKAYVRGDFENGKFDQAADRVRDAQVKAEKIIIRNMPIMQLVVYSCIIAALWFGGSMIVGNLNSPVTGGLTAGGLITFISYVGQVLMSLMILSMIFITMVLSRASIQRINEVLEEKIEIQNPAENAVMSVRDGSVDFENVYFSYVNDKSNTVLDNVSLHINSGELVGILGGTGSSKTTLVSLISRLYDVLEGSVRVGGTDVRQYDLKVLRDSVAVVLQKNVLFSGTIRDNLKWGNEDASDQELLEACRASDAYDFVLAQPQGLDTYLGQSGVNLSGGQKQRICIARALLKKPKVLILDDSTSAVDTATDSRIRAALRSSLPDTTKVIIAQRISSVQDADRIFVLDNGKLDGQGKHTELLESNAIYREVYESQK